MNEFSLNYDVSCSVMPLPSPMRCVLSSRRTEDYCKSEENVASSISLKNHSSKQYGLNFDESDDSEESEANLKFASTMARVDEALLVGGDSFSPNLRGSWAFGTLLVLFFGVCANKMLNATDMQQSSYSLAPAAIQSVTDVLGPILPFTGGVDLRRDDFNVWQLMFPESVAESWEMRWHKFGSKSDSAKKLDQIATEVGNNEAQTTLTLASRSSRWTKDPRRDVVISAPEAFLPTNKISKLTLDGLTHVFQYVLQVNRPTFDRVAFTASLDQNILSVLDAIDSAASQSRGIDVLMAKAVDIKPIGEVMSDSDSSDFRFGDVDTLYFCAAMRIFAEWRMLRQVPEGYKGYEVGMSLGRKDCVQNLVKVEHAAHHYIEERAEFLRRTLNSNTGSPDIEQFLVRSPSLRELLIEEIELGDHEKLPRLKEKSAAMGLLWVRRQLNYQIAIFDHINSGMHATSEEAVLAAYRDVYSDFHGWAVQKIFGYSFQAAPPIESILKLMHKEYYEIILDQATNLDTASNQFIIAEADDHVSNFDNVTDIGGNSKQGDPIGNFMRFTTGEFSKVGNYVTNELQRLGNHIAGEWDNIASNLLRLVKIGGNQESRASHLSGSSEESRLEGDALEQYVNKNLMAYNQQSLIFHFTVVKPLLQDLAGLFDEFNMDDPAKV